MRAGDGGRAGRNPADHGRAWPRRHGDSGRPLRRGPRPGVAPLLPIGAPAGLRPPAEPGLLGVVVVFPARHRRRLPARDTAGQQRSARRRRIHRATRRERDLPRLHRADPAARPGDAAGRGDGRGGLDRRRSRLRHVALPAGGSGRERPRPHREVRRDRVFAVAVTFGVTAVALATGAVLFPIGRRRCCRGPP